MARLSRHVARCEGDLHLPSIPGAARGPRKKCRARDPALELHGLHMPQAMVADAAPWACAAACTTPSGRMSAQMN